MSNEKKGENMTIEKWEIDAAHSSIVFSVRHMVVSRVHGAFTKWSGKLELDTSALAEASVTVDIDAGSIDTRDAQRDGHLKSPDFLDAEQFPKIEFRSTSVEKTGAEKFRVSGDLTIHGVKRQIVLEAEYGGRAKDPWGGERIGITAKTKIDRKEFGLQWNVALETGGVLVGETIVVTVEVEAKKVA